MNFDIDSAIAHEVYMLVVAARSGITELHLANSLSESHKAYLFRDRTFTRFFSLLSFLERQNIIRVLSYYSPPDTSKFRIFASSHFIGAAANDETHGDDKKDLPESVKVRPVLSVIAPENKVLVGKFNPVPR